MEFVILSDVQTEKAIIQLFQQDNFELLVIKF